MGFQCQKSGEMPRKKKGLGCAVGNCALSAEENCDEEICKKKGTCLSRLLGSWCEMRESFEKCQGFKLKDLTSFHRFVRLMYRPTDPASLGVARALFGEFLRT